jgi:hypothetical protein
MKQVPLVVALWIGMMAGADRAHGQLSRQNLSVSIYEQYATNTFSTNHNTGEVTERQLINTALISPATIVKDIAVDLFGADYTNWTGASLVRVADFTNGHEGVFLYKASPPAYVNVSAAFSMSYISNFTSQAAGNFNPIPNLNGIPPLSGDYNELVSAPASNWGVLTNFGFSVSNLVQAGDYFVETSQKTNTVIVTNVNTLASAGLGYLSLNTTNLQLSLLGSVVTGTTNLIGRIGAATNRFTNLVQFLSFNVGVGTYRANLGTNLLAPGPDDFVSGPAHGTFSTGLPAFSTNSPEEVFGP